MLAGSVSDLQSIMDRLTMVSVNYNMKINTKKTNVSRVTKGSESAMKIVFAGEIIEQVKKFCYLGSMISDDATEKTREGSQQRRQSGLKSGGSKISISTGKFPKNFNFFRQFYKRISSFPDKFPKILIFSGNYNMKINTKKTNVSRVTKGSESAMKIVFAGEIIEQVKEFCYLGSMISRQIS